MKHFLLSIQQPDGPPPASVDMEAVIRDVAALEGDMRAAGVWVFNDHLLPPDTSTVLRAEGDEVLTIDGPYAEGKEHIGGIAVIRVPDLDTALEWGGRLTRATRLPVEVRAFQRDADQLA